MFAAATGSNPPSRVQHAERSWANVRAIRDVDKAKLRRNLKAILLNVRETGQWVLDLNVQPCDHLILRLPASQEDC